MLYSAESVEALMRKNEALSRRLAEGEEAWRRERAELKYVNRRLVRSLEESERVVVQCKGKLSSVLTHFRGRLDAVEEQLERRARRAARELDRVERLPVPEAWLSTPEHVAFLAAVQQGMDRARALMRAPVAGEQRKGKEAAAGSVAAVAAAREAAPPSWLPDGFEPLRRARRAGPAAAEDSKEEKEGGRGHTRAARLRHEILELDAEIVELQDRLFRATLETTPPPPPPPR